MWSSGDHALIRPAAEVSHAVATRRGDGTAAVLPRRPPAVVGQDRWPPRSPEDHWRGTRSRDRREPTAAACRDPDPPSAVFVAPPRSGKAQARAVAVLLEPSRSPPHDMPAVRRDLGSFTIRNRSRSRDVGRFMVAFHRRRASTCRSRVPPSGHQPMLHIAANPLGSRS
jgi:hypothetical protein